MTLLDNSSLACAMNDKIMHIQLTEDYIGTGYDILTTCTMMRLLTDTTTFQRIISFNETSFATFDNYNVVNVLNCWDLQNCHQRKIIESSYFHRMPPYITEEREKKELRLVSKQRDRSRAIVVQKYC